jgi:predicted transcriptional regulator
MADKDVQTVWDGLEEALFKRWKAAATKEDRDSLWAMARALGDLKVALQAAVDAGQAEAHSAERSRNQH